MTVVVPNSLALTSIADGASIIASDHRNNYAAVQVGVNGLVAMFQAAPTKGDLLVSLGGGSFDKLGVGANAQAIVADSTQALGVKWAYPVGYEFGYSEFTSNVGITATTEATAAAVVTAPAITFDGSTIAVIEFFSPAVNHGTTGQEVTFVLYDGASSIGKLGIFDEPAAGDNIPVRLTRRLTPAAATKTYSIRAYVSAGTAFVSGGVGGVGAIVPGFVRVTKVA